MGKRMVRLLICLLCAAFLLPSCARTPSPAQTTDPLLSEENESTAADGASSTAGLDGTQESGGTPDGDDPAPAVTPEPGPEGDEQTRVVQQPQATPAPISVHTPRASGTVVLGENGAVIDASHTDQGYFMAKCTGAGNRLKVRVTCGENDYYYDLNRDGRYEVIPLQFGSGSYQVGVYQLVSGSSYTPLCVETIRVSLSSAFLPFLYPSQYVDFSASSSAVRRAYDLCAGISSDVEKVRAVYHYIIEHIRYDKAKAQAVSGATGYLSDVDATLSAGSGICFDYAALLAAMLRCQDVPVKLVVGNANGASHAWDLVYTKEAGWITAEFSANAGAWNRMDPTFGAAKGKGVDAFIGNGSNYTALRIY